MELIFITIAGVIILLMAPALPVTWRFSAAIVLSVPQLYLLPVGDFYLSLALIASFFLWPEAIKEARGLFRQKILFFALAVLIIQAISLLWSTDLRLGLRTLVYALPFLLIAASAYSIAKHNPRFVYTILGITGGAMIIEAALVVAFRLSPELEMAFLTSNLPAPLINPNVKNEFLLGETSSFIILDPEKSAGFLPYPNPASAYLGIGSFIAFMVGHTFKSRTILATSITLWLSIFFTGSKAGIMLAVAIPLLALAFVHYSRHDKHSRTLIMASTWIAAPIMLILAVYALDSLAEKSSFAAASIDTASIRLLIWNYAAQAFAESPLFGQGFGGWQQGYDTYALARGISPDFPPHNTLIYLWSQSGILASILGLVFMFHVMRLAYRLAISNQQKARLLGLTLGMVAGWLFIQGMGENWGLFGEPHQQPIFAALVGLAYATLRSSADNRAPAHIISDHSNTQTKSI